MLSLELNEDEEVEKNYCLFGLEDPCGAYLENKMAFTLLVTNKLLFSTAFEVF